MSKAAISYTSLKNAATEASFVAKKLNAYADNLNRGVYEKLNSYSGSHTSNLSGAKNKTKEKISGLRNKADAYTKYATDLTDLKERCDSVDVAVKNEVARLTADFRGEHGIRNGKVVGNINYLLTSISHSSAAGRWLSDKGSRLKSVRDYIAQSQEDWWDYEGGKQAVKGWTEAIVTWALSATVLVGMAFSGIGGVVLLAAVISAAIFTANLFTNGANEIRAYRETYYNGDPASGRRISKINTLTEEIRTDSDSSVWHGIAAAIDVTAVACEVVLFANGLSDLVKRGVTWVKELSGGTWKSFASNMQRVTTAVKEGNTTFLKTAANRAISGFGNNLKKSFWNFDSVESGVSSVKNMLKVANDLLKDDASVRKIAGDVVLPAIRLSDDLSALTDGQIPDAMPDISLGEIVGTFNKGKDIFDSIKGFFSGSTSSFSTEGSRDVLDKLSQRSGIHISVPEIYVPDVTMPVFRAA